MTDEKQPQRHHPAHHAPVERFNELAIVQVNVCTKDRQPILACAAGHRLCHDVWEAADFWRVGQYVIMPDHIHLFCTPGRVPMPSLRQWVEYWKSRIAARWPITMDDTEVVPWTRMGTGGSGSVPTGIATGKTDRTEPVPPGNRMGTGGSASVRTGTADRTEPVPPGNRMGTGGSASVRTGIPDATPFKLWQRDFWDTQMRSREHYDERLSYVRMNPVRKELVKTPEEWPYQGVIQEIGWM